MSGEQTIAEIIGWHPEPVECTNGGFSHAPPRCTVDDLLAWLLRAADTQDGVEFGAYWSSDGYGDVADFDDEVPSPRTFIVHVGISDEDGDMHTRITTGSTLLAALEAAVRTAL